VVNQPICWLGRIHGISLESVEMPPRRCGFYTTGSLDSVCETFMDMKNPARDEPMHKNDMTNVLEDTNQGTHAQGDFCYFLSYGNVA
jgi:hypothetical protein